MKEEKPGASDIRRLLCHNTKPKKKGEERHKEKQKKLLTDTHKTHQRSLVQ